MEFQEYMRQKRRMANPSEWGACRNECSNCPLSIFNNQFDMYCKYFEILHPDKAEAIVQTWAAEHPEKTFLMDFKEKYPKAELNSLGVPFSCVRDLGYVSECKAGISCVECWNTPMKGVENAVKAGNRREKE